MKRYLVYYDKKAKNGISAVDYVAALEKARKLTPKGDRKHIRVRLARAGTLLGSLASQGEYR